MRTSPGRQACCPRGAFVAVLFLPCLAACYAQCNAPTITSITPDVWFAGQTFNITIAGTSLDCGGTFLSVEADQGTVTPATLSNVTWSANQVTAVVSIPADTPTEKACVGLIVDQDGPIQHAAAETAAASASRDAAAAAGASGACGSTYYYEADKAVHIVAAPKIFWRGELISGPNAAMRTVKVGQPVELTTKPASLSDGLKIVQPTWSIDGTNIGSYDGSSAGISLTDTVVNSTNTTFYWLYPSEGLNVTYTFCAQDQSGNQFCTSPPAQATFDAEEPTLTLTTTEPYPAGKVNKLAVCGQKQRDAYLFYGNLNYPPGKCSPPYTGLEGIDLTASGANGGTYVFAQVISSDTLSWGGTTPFQCGPYANVLDGEFPFAGVRPSQLAPTSAHDGPGMELPNQYSSGERNFDAVMYLLWKPAQLKGTSTASIPVPIGYQEWHFIATTEQEAPIGRGKWKKPVTTAHGDVGPFQPSQPTDNALYGYPMWSGVAGIGSCDPDNQTEETDQ